MTFDEKYEEVAWQTMVGGMILVSSSDEDFLAIGLGPLPKCARQLTLMTSLLILLSGIIPRLCT